MPKSYMLRIKARITKKPIIKKNKKHILLKKIESYLIQIKTLTIIT